MIYQTLAVALFLTAPAIASSNGNKLRMTAPCTLFMKEIQAEGRKSKTSWECLLDPIDTGGSDGQFVKVVGVDIDESTAVSGSTLLEAPNAVIEGHTVNVANAKNTKFTKKSGPPKLNSLTGDKSVLVVHINATDTSTTTSVDGLSNYVFGTNDDKFNLKTAYEQCSYDKLRFYPGKHDQIDQDGVVSINLDINVAGQSNSVVRNAATAELEAVLGENPATAFDHVMLCIPPGTSGGWIAYAYINSWLSVYNDQWCNRPSGQVHEIGHNLGLAHSNEGASSYADQSCMMGYSYSSTTGPIMCFNGAKNWQLGWYPEQTESVDNPDNGWEDNIIGINNYTGDSNASRVLVRLPAQGNKQYFIAFNHKEGISSGTKEGGNQIMITSRTDGTGYAESNLERKLNAGNTFTISDIYPNNDIFVEVLQINLSASPAFARVRIFPENATPTASPKTPTRSPTKSPTSSPKTTSPTKSPTKLPTSPPKTSLPTTAPITSSPTTAPITSSPTIDSPCGPNESLLEIKIQADNNSKSQNKYVVHSKTGNRFNKIINVKQGKLLNNELHVNKVCIKNGVCHRFILNDSGKDGICCDKGLGHYQISLGGTELHYSLFQNGKRATILFSDVGTEPCGN